MKTALVILVALFSASVLAQGTFQNLDFESANPVSAGNPFDPSQITFASAFPGWSGSIGGNVPSTSELNNYSLGAAEINIFGPGWSGTQPGIIDGSYTAFLQAFFPGQGNVSLYQNGTVPVNAESLQFSAWALTSTGGFSVSFAGNSLAPVLLSSEESASGQPFNVYAVNIAPYAGQTGQLEFTAFANTQTSQIELDDITFSTQTVPEPGTFVLTGIGGFLFALYRRFARKRLPRTLSSV
jgi:hypothetical protein